MQKLLPFPYFLACLFVPLSFFSLPKLNAQITVSPAFIDFGTVSESSPDSVMLTLSNAYNYDVHVTQVQTLDDNYMHFPFSVSQSNFTIPLLDYIEVWVKFAPVHNLYHESELLFYMDAQPKVLRVDIKGQGHYSNTYYNSTENLSDQALKTALTTKLAQSYTSLGYNSGRDAMYMQVDNQKVNGQGASVNTVECIYTGRLATNYQSRAEAQAQSFNTEHTFPQSFFSSSEPMLSDLYHIFPTDDAANSERANNPFGMVTSPTWQNGGSKSNGNIFEPRDVHKGKAARALLYFCLRYQDYSCFVQGQESTLRQWNQTYLPSTVEKTRNNVINTLQHNRNPFIDYPQFIERMSAVTSCQTAVGATIISAILPQDSLNYGIVPQGSTPSLTYLVVNDGNQNLALTTLTTSSPALTWLNGGGGDTTVAAGEGVIWTLQLNSAALPAGNYVGDISFQTNLPAQTTVTVPVMAYFSTASLPTPTVNVFSVSPNPMHNFFRINTTLSSVNYRLYNVYGECLQQGNAENNSQISLQNIPQGMYVLSVNGQNVKIVVE